jgi:hypothetical protein
MILYIDRAYNPTIVSFGRKSKLFLPQDTIVGLQVLSMYNIMSYVPILLFLPQDTIVGLQALSMYNIMSYVQKK